MPETIFRERPWLSFKLRKFLLCNLRNVIKSCRFLQKASCVTSRSSLLWRETPTVLSSYLDNTSFIVMSSKIWLSSSPQNNCFPFWPVASDRESNSSIDAAGYFARNCIPAFCGTASGAANTIEENYESQTGDKFVLTNPLISRRRKYLLFYWSPHYFIIG